MASPDAQPFLEAAGQNPPVGETVLDPVAPDTPLKPFGLDVQPAIDLIDKGGPVVVVLLVLSVIATTVIVVKVASFLWLGLGSRRRTERALILWFSERRHDAVAAVARASQPAATVLAGAMRGVMSGHEERLVREDVERVAVGQIARLRSQLRILDVTVQAAPLLGLFGTVIGMIAAFQALQSAGADADPTVLAGGIWVALMTTAVGLAVAIPIAFVNAWLDGRIEAEQRVMEDAVTSLLTGRASERDVRAKVGPGAQEPGIRIAHAAE